jgi:hypothetical protein
LWLSLEEAHGINYDRIIRNNNSKHNRDVVKQAMAQEFGYFVEYAKICRFE